MFEMAMNSLEWLTMVSYCFLPAATILIFLCIGKCSHSHVWNTSRTTFLLFMIFTITLFSNSIYLSIPHKSRVGMIQSDRIHVPPPEIYLEYPLAARTGEEVEIVLEAENANFLTNIEASLVDSDTGKTIVEGLMTIEQGGSEAKIFTVTMPDKDFKITFMAIHPDTLSELRTTIAITRAGLDIYLDLK